MAAQVEGGASVQIGVGRQTLTSVNGSDLGQYAVGVLNMSYLGANFAGYAASYWRIVVEVASSVSVQSNPIEGDSVAA